MTKINDFAPAKINLTLHVLGQRPDGYHLLDSLVVFADFGDRIEVSPNSELALSVDGPFADGVPTGEENLVLKAARLLDPVRGASIHLHKELPSAAGIGGGSSDAAATLRALGEMWGMPLPGNAMTLGADVPMCLDPKAARISGAGEGRMPVEGLPAMPAVLVNPRVGVPTPAAFKGLATKNNAPMPDVIPDFADVTAAADWLAGQRNDLSAPAREIAPVIDDVLAVLDDALLARMSGSGATCFGLYPDIETAQQTALRIAAKRPDWWVVPVTLNP